PPGRGGLPVRPGHARRSRQPDRRSRRGVLVAAPRLRRRTAERPPRSGCPVSTTAPIQPSVLDAFSAAGVLSVADVNVAEALGRLAGGAPAEVLLAAAL